MLPSITPNTGAVYGVQYLPNLLKTSYADRTIVVGVYSAASTAYSSTTQAPGQTTYRYYKEVFAYNPVAAAAWTINGVNNAQPILKIAT